MADVFLNVKRPRRVWFPDNINGLYPLGKAEIGEDVYQLSDAIRNFEVASNNADSTSPREDNKKQDLNSTRDREIKNTKRKLENLKANLENQKNTLERVRSEIKRHREAIGRTEYEIETAEEEQKSLEENYQSLKEDYTQSIKSSKHNREGYEKSILEIRDQLIIETKLPREIFGSHEEVPRLKQEISDRNDRCTDLRANLKGSTRQRTMMQELLTKQSGPSPSHPNQAMVIQQLVEYARSSAKQYETFKLKLRDTDDKKKKAFQELEKRKREIQSLGEEMAKQIRLNADLKEKDNELTKKSEAQREQAVKFQEEMRQLKEEELRREQELQILTERHISWQQMLEVTENRAKQAEEAFIKANAEVKVFNLGKRTLEATAERLTKKQKVLELECADLQSQIEGHEKGSDDSLKDKEQLDALIAECRSLYQKKQSLAKEVSKKETLIEKRKEEVKKLRSHFEKVQARIHEQQEEHTKQVNVSNTLASQFKEKV